MDLSTLQRRIDTGNRQMRVAGAAVVGLIGVGFSDLTGVIGASGAPPQVIALYASALLLTGLMLGNAWYGFNDAQAYVHRVVRAEEALAAKSNANASPFTFSLGRLALSWRIRPRRVMKRSATDEVSPLSDSVAADETSESAVVATFPRPDNESWRKRDWDNLLKARYSVGLAEWYFVGAYIGLFIAASGYLWAVWTWAVSPSPVAD